MADRPNILLITADQHRGDCLGHAGRRVRTPHLDRLAEDGTRFEMALCPSPVCQPARASMLTGQLCRTHGVHDNGIDLDPSVGARGFAGALAAAGYRTAFFGKAHFSTYHTFEPTGTPECVVSSADYPDDWTGPYMGFDHVDLMLVGHNWFAPERPPRGHGYERFFHADGRGEERQRLYWADGGRDTAGAAQCWHSQLPPAYHNTPWTADRAIDWLRHGRGDEPFCAWVSFPDPHHPFDCPEPWSLLHDPAEVDLPPVRSRNLAGKPWWHRAALENEPQGPADSVATRKSYSRLPPQTDDQLRHIVANTYGQIALIDAHVGRLLATLDDLGLTGSTLVVYTSDHGDWLGDHGLILKGPMFYDGLMRVPLILRGPGVSRGRRIAAPVSTLDLAPTFMEAAGAAPLLPLHGASLMPLSAGTGDRRYAMSEWELLPGRVGVALSLRMVRDRTHKLTVDLRSGAGELYDIATDPWETRNLFDDPDAIDARRRLEAYLAERPDDIGPIRTPVGTA